MRDYIELFYLQKTNLTVTIGRSIDECKANNFPGPYVQQGKFYVLLDRDRIAVLAASFFATSAGNGQLRSAIAGEKLSFVGLTGIGRPFGFDAWELVVFESPRPTFSHTKQPASWAIST